MDWKEFFRPSKLTKWSKILFFIGVLVVVIDLATVKLRLVCDSAGDMICVGVQHILTGMVSGTLLAVILILLIVNKLKK